MLDDAGVAANLRAGVIADRTTVDWKFEPATGEWTSLWDGRTFAGWDHAGSGGFQRVLDDGAPALQAQGRAGSSGTTPASSPTTSSRSPTSTTGSATTAASSCASRIRENRAIADEGYQVAILDRVDNVAQRTGSVLGCAAAQKLNAKPVGEGYNTFRIRFVGTDRGVPQRERAGERRSGGRLRHRRPGGAGLRRHRERGRVDPLPRHPGPRAAGRRAAPAGAGHRDAAVRPRAARRRLPRGRHGSRGQGITYAWDFGDGTTGSGQSPTHTYAQAGYYQAEVTATDGKGATSSAQIQIAAASPGACLRVEAGYCVADLTGHYNTDGISEEGDFDDGNFDDAGWAFAGDTMPPAGPVTYHGVPFEFPSYAPGALNTVEARGQVLPFAPGNYEEIRLLASAHHGSPSSTATIATRTARRPAGPAAADRLGAVAAVRADRDRGRPPTRTATRGRRSTSSSRRCRPTRRAR